MKKTCLLAYEKVPKRMTFQSVIGCSCCGGLKGPSGLKVILADGRTDRRADGQRVKGVRLFVAILNHSLLSITLYNSRYEILVEFGPIGFGTIGVHFSPIVLAFF